MIFLVESSAISCCPVCGKPLSYRDSCVRIMRLEGGIKRRFLIRRLKCCNCGKLHRELPDCLAPYKHYASEVISGVLDGIVTPEDDDSADFPCETTMRRWHCWLEANRLRIDGYLKSTGYRLLGFSMELLGSRWDSPWNFWDPGCRCSISCEVHDRNGWKHCSGSCIIPEVFLSPFNIQALHRLCFAVTTSLWYPPCKGGYTNEKK